MKNYLIYGGFIIILIYVLHKSIKFVLNKVEDNTYSKKELLEYREEYKKKINEFKKLYNEIKTLYNEETQIGVKYNQLRKNYINTTNYCNKLNQNLNGVGNRILKQYSDHIVPIYDGKPAIILEQQYRKWLNPDEVKSVDYYKKFARKESGIADLPPDPSKSWRRF